MAKASLTLANGTSVTIEGSPTEVHELLTYYGAGQIAEQSKKKRKEGKARNPIRAVAKTEHAAEAGPDLAGIVNLVKTCDEAEQIESEILNRVAQVDRILLPLYIVHEHYDNATGLSSGEISRILTDLGVPISQPNVSKALSSTVSKYVMGDGVRKKGQMVRYKLSRRGMLYLESVIAGKTDENQG
jgi:hypothetical protein